MRVLGIAGKAHAGKDLTAKMMRDFLMGKGKKVIIVHLADKLKRIVKLAFDWGDEMVNTVKKDQIVEGTNYTPRWVLQQLGTEFFREKISEDFWVDSLLSEKNINHWKEECGCDFLIIPDIRFDSEAIAIKNLGGKIYRINRPSLNTKDNHSSERAIDGYLIDEEIINDGTLEWLSNKVEKEVLILLGKQHDSTI